MTSHDPFDAAHRLAPTPDTPEEATRANWIRHYAALAVAAHVAFRAALRTIGPNPEPGSRPDLGYLIAIAVASTAAAAALADPGNAPELIYNLTPEAGALNGEDLDWLDETLVAYGINPADIDPDLDPADFAAEVAAPGAAASS